MKKLAIILCAIFSILLVACSEKANITDSDASTVYEPPIIDSIEDIISDASVSNELEVIAFEEKEFELEEQLAESITEETVA